MDHAHTWDGLAWKTTLRALCGSPFRADAGNDRLRGLACELAEVYAADLAHAVTAFPRHVMRAWNIGEDETLGLIDRCSPISQGTPRWRDVEVELATICLSALEASLCALCREQTFADIDLRMHVRRVCFESVFGFFLFILRGSSPSH